MTTHVSALFLATTPMLTATHEETGHLRAQGPEVR